MLIHAVKDRRVRLLVETHSEHLLLRLRRRIAEASARNAPNPLSLQPQDCAAYFVDRLRGVSTASLFSFDNRGAFVDQPYGFRDFFADDMHEVLALSRAGRAAEPAEQGDD